MASFSEAAPRDTVHDSQMEQVRIKCFSTVQLGGFGELMLQAASTKVLNYMLDREWSCCEISLADVWILECSSEHNVFNACLALQHGEAEGGASKRTAAQIKYALQRIRQSSAKKSWKRNPEAAHAFGRDGQFRLRPTTPPPPKKRRSASSEASSAAAAAAAAVVVALPVTTADSAAANPPAAAAASSSSAAASRAVEWHLDTYVVVAEQRVGVSRGRGLSEGGAAFVVGISPGGLTDVVYTITGLREEGVDPSRIQPSRVALLPREARVLEELRRARDRRRADMDALESSRSRNSQCRVTIKELRATLAESEEQYAALWRGTPSEGGAPTRGGRSVVAALQAAAREEHDEVVASLKRHATKQRNTAKYEASRSSRCVDSLRGAVERERAQGKHMRALKNAALLRARQAEKRLAIVEKRLQAGMSSTSATARMAVSRMAPDIRAAVERAELDAATALETVDQLEAQLEQLESRTANKLRVNLLDEMAVGSGKYSLAMLEYGLELMARGLTVADARGSMRAVMHVAYPNSVEGKDYRIMGETTLKKLRRVLKPLMQVLAIQRLTDAQRWHIIHDATSKGGNSIFAATVVVEYPDGRVEKFPLDAAMLTDGDSKTEADALLSFLQHKKLGAVAAAKIDLSALASATSDDAEPAHKTSKLLRDFQALERRQEAAVAALGEALQEIGGADADLEMVLAVLRCSNHQLNLISEAAHAKEMERQRALADQLWATHVLRRAVCRWVPRLHLPQRRVRTFSARFCFGYNLNMDIIIPEGALYKDAYKTQLPVELPLQHTIVDAGAVARSTSKLFSGNGRDSDYYLSLHRDLCAHLAKMEASEDPKVRAQRRALGKLVSLPAVKGSRQMIGTELAAAIIQNRKIYMHYLSVRMVGEDRDNALMKNVWEGLSNYFCVCALKARAAVFVSVIEPFRFVLNSLATRPQTRRVFAVMESAIEALPSTRAHEVLSARVQLGQLEYPEWAGWSDRLYSWAENASVRSEAVLRLVREEEHAVGVRWLLQQAAPGMLAKLRHNVDADCSNRPDLVHAPVNSDRVESYFGVLDMVLTRNPNLSPYAALGVASAKQSGAFRGRAEEEERKRRKRWGKSRAEDGSAAEGEGDQDDEDGQGDADFMIYRRLPISVREQLLRYLLSRSGFREAVVDVEQGAAAAQRAESHARQAAKSLAADRAKSKHAGLYAQYGVMKRAKNVTELDALLGAQEIGGDKLDVLADQVRIRKYVFMDKDLPTWSKWKVATLAEHRTKVLEMIAAEETERRPPPPPSVLAARAVNPSRDSVRAEYDGFRARLLASANEEFGRLITGGLLKAHNGDTLPPLADGRLAITAESLPRRALRRGAAAERGADRVRAIVGAELSDDNDRCTYKVLSVFWSLAHDTPLCLYYDVDRHAEADEAAIKADPAAFEYAFTSVAEHVLAWHACRPIERV